MVKTKKRNVLTALATAVLIAAGIVSAGMFSVKAGSVTSAVPLHYTDYATFAEEQAAAEQLLAQIGEEGSVLLKNNGTLPFDANVKNISMFGAASVDPCYGGGGSGSANFSSYQTKVTPQMALESAGFKVNPRLVNFYENEYLPSHPKTATDNSEIKYAYQEPTATELQAVESSFSLYGDAALIFKYGSGSEGTDKLRTEYDDGKEYSDAENGRDGVTSPGATHNLEFTPRELDLIDYVAARFDKVILILNTGNAVEMSWVQDNPDIDGILWVGNPGTSGFSSLGKLLNGTANPSGRLTDIYPANFTQDPSWYNYGDNSQTTGVYQAYDKDGELVSGIAAGRVNSDQGVPLVEYEEGIYYGYRWYETAAADGRFQALAGEVDLSAHKAVNSPDNEDLYYNRYNGVVYPFGYGLSYTNFKWELVDTAATAAIVADSEITLKVKVTNEGKTAGKDVVQVYYDPHYTDGGIEKAPVNLIDFAKTKLLAPGESQTLTISFMAKDMASFDYDNKNNDADGFCGYELEANDYAISLRANSHTVKDGCTVTRTVAEDIRYDGSTDALNWNYGYGETAEAVFSQDDNFNSLNIGSANENAIMTLVTRADEGLIMPQAPTLETSKVDDKTLAYIDEYNVFTPLNDSEDDPWYVTNDDIPADWTQGDVKGITAAEMAGIDPDNATDTIVSGNKELNGKTGKEAWTLFMNQLSFDELKSLMSCRSEAVATIAMPAVSAADGPAQLKGTPVGTYWCCETLIGTTWNTDLAYKQGVMVGNEGLFQNMLGWWGPGMNIHRSPFSGRNFEYYGQDGVQNGYFAAAVCAGADSKGLVTYAKHFAVNDQESFREANDGVSTWLSEQAMREIYLKPFEFAVKYGRSKGLMTSYNRIGAVSADVNYRLMQDVCRGEWGFDGNFVADANAVNARYYEGGTTKHDNLAIRTGCVSLSGAMNVAGTWDASLRDGKGGVMFDPSKYITNGSAADIAAVEDPNGYFAARNIAQNFLYVHINSFALRNGVDTAAFAGKSLTAAYVNVGYSQSLAADLGDLNASCATYELTDGALPAGMTLSAAGTIAGTPTVKGSYEFTVKMAADYSITASRTFKLDVVSPFTVTGDAMDNVMAGEDFETQIAFALASEYKDPTFSIAGGALPAGLSLAEDGLIYGAATESGTFEFTVRVSAQTTDKRPSTVTFSETYTITVAGAETAPLAIGANGNWYINGEDTGVKAAGVDGKDGTTPTIAIGDDGYWYINGVKTDTLAQGPKGDTGANGEDAAAGCGGNVGGTAAVIGGALLALGAAAFVIRKKNKN